MVEIYVNRIFATYYAEDEEIDIFTIRNIVQKSVARLTNIAGFSNGVFLTVEITTIKEDSQGISYVYGVDNGILREFIDGFKFDASSILSSPHLLNDLYLDLMLSDFRETLMSATNTAFFSYRILETIMQSFRQIGGFESKKPAWEMMKSSLLIDESIIRKIEHRATPHRHGDVASFDIIDGLERDEILKFTWSAIEKYIQYIVRNPLD